MRIGAGVARYHRDTRVVESTVGAASAAILTQYTFVFIEYFHTRSRLKPLLRREQSISMTPSSGAISPAFQ